MNRYETVSKAFHISQNGQRPPTDHIVGGRLGGNIQAEGYGQQPMDDDEDDDDDENDDGRDNYFVESDSCSFPIHKELQYIVECAKEFSRPREGQTEKQAHLEALRGFKEKAKSWKYLRERSEETGECILHMMLKAENLDGGTMNQLSRAMRWIVQTSPDLLTVINESMTPLYAALYGMRGQRNNSSRIYLIKNGLFPPASPNRMDKWVTMMEHLTKAIEIPCGHDQENCLHMALRLTQRSKVILDLLLDYASVAAINATDKDGYTPLHRAVEFDHSSEETLDILKRLIEKGDTGQDQVPSRAFDPPDNPNQGLESVYLYHRASRKRSDRASTSKGDSKKAANDPEPENDEVRIPTQPRPQEPKREAPGQQRKNHQAKPSTGAGRITAVAKDDSKEENFLKPTAPRRANTGSSRAKQSSGPVQNRNASLETNQKWSDEIQQELKLHCLRTRSIDQATRFIYGSNKDNTQLYFDYSGMRENADAMHFDGNFKATPFAPELQYVEFPIVRLVNDQFLHKNTFAEYKALFDSIKARRKDLLFFFHWLKGKGVKHIISLTVNDSKDSHDDEVIRHCLSGLKVDKLNWSKPDLDPEMLCAACPDVRELHLRWGGNNAILRAWSEQDGLRTLPHLERIHLYYGKDQGLCEENAKRFERRIQTPLPPVEPHTIENNRDEDDTRHDGKVNMGSQQSPPIEIVHISDWHPDDPQSMSGAGLPSADSAKPTAHKWLTSIDEFASEFKTIMQNIRDLHRDDEEVRVALIDDGVTVEGQEFQGKLINGKSFGYFHDGLTLREKQWYVSDTDHGTTMARLILRVCPLAKIYPIKLDTVTNTDNRGVQIKTQSAIRAIEAAVEKEVDIISMSWTVETPKDQERVQFDRALTLAAEKNILMFCSSSDNGRFTDQQYPSAWGPDKLIRIGACMANGKHYEWVKPEMVDFLIPGVEVVSKTNSVYLWGGASGGVEGDKHAETGSSVSTALAAGLAALLSWLVKVGVRYSMENHQSDGLDASDLRRLREISDLKHAFRSLGGNSVGTNEKFIEIWHALEAPSRTLRRHRGRSESDIREARRAIHALARNLIPKA